MLAEAAGIDRSRPTTSSPRAPPLPRGRLPPRRSSSGPDGAPVVVQHARSPAKDFGLILGLASELGARLPQAELNADVVRAAIAAGRGEQDIAAVVAHLRDG